MKKGWITAACAMLAALTAGASSPLTINDIAARLEAPGTHVLDGRLSVTMPQLANDVVYSLRLTQLPAVEGDTLAPAPYVIDWRREETENDAHGFSAYYPGNHYRIQGSRLLEYHYDTDPHPFGREQGRGGVQQTAQFAGYLPAFLGRELREMAADPRYSVKVAQDTTVNGAKAVVVSTLMTVGGVTASEGEYLLDPATLLPRRITVENNPGSISEQTIEVQLSEQTSPTLPAEPLSEEVLMALYPDEFATMRRSSYRLENLPGRMLPSFEAPCLDGERYAHTVGERLPEPTLIVVLEADNALTPNLIADVRGAMKQLPFAARTIWAFADKHSDAVESLVGRVGADETVLLGAKGLARECGVADMPAMISVGSDGKVSFAAYGYNKSIASDVINMLTR